MLKTYKYRVYPNAEQEVSLQQQFGCVRWVYNWGLETKIQFYQEYKKGVSFFDLVLMLPFLKEELPWLKDCYSQALQASLLHLDNAFKCFFREKKGFPNFKKRSNRKSLEYASWIQVDFTTSFIKVPKLGLVRAVFDRQFEGKIKTCTLVQVPSGKYFMSIMVDNGKELPLKPDIKCETSLGIDFGINNFITCSDGTKVINPKHHKRLDKRIRCLNRRRSHKQKGSKNRNKARVRTAKKHEKVVNQRQDFLHKLSHQIVCKSQADTIVIENLNIAGMVKNRKLSRALSESSWNRFERMLKYKCDWYGKNLIYIGRFEPSSKMCSSCGTLNQELTLSTCMWTCACGALHDRDINAAINIKQFGLIRQNLISLKPPTDRGVEPAEMSTS